MAGWSPDGLMDRNIFTTPEARFRRQQRYHSHHHNRDPVRSIESHLTPG
ncbi:hypothetical protein BofuT4_uP009220.1 [Botrytis cinerea T4]|uniref:Uncharacterized protein n=1 Tax=Botryotinia fuckeliana (strain T4) TaxID=999810 RepID=G2XXC7_BOTF4|nr:hypothetical protein BofuT4_uP009220.1 [Botrytis cinerea T4]